MRGRAWLVGVAVMSLAAAAYGQGGSSNFDLDVFRKLDTRDMTAIVVGELHKRDAKLQNFKLEVTESWSRLDSGGGLAEPIAKYSREVLRNRGKNLVKGVNYANTGEVVSEFSASWDGITQRAFTQWHDNKQAPLQGSVKDAEAQAQRDLAYNNLLGFRTLSSSMTLPEWVEDAAKHGATIATAVAEDGGKSLIALKITVPPVQERTYWLDPSRDFMPVKYKYWDGGNSELQTVTESEQIDGVWVPMKVVRRTGSTAVPGKETEMVYQVKKFSIGTVEDADLEVKFPPGTEVVDNIAKVAYRVNDQGPPEMIPLVDPQTGQVIDPRPRSMNEALEEASHTNPDDTPPSAANHTAASPLRNQSVPSAMGDGGGRGALFWLAGGLGLAVVAVVVFLALHRRRARV